MHQARVVTRPLEVFVDFVGPMLGTRAGNQAIFVILEGFSKYVAMYPVKRITSKVVVDIWLKHYFPASGMPKILVSDNAAVFTSRLFYNTCFSWGVRHVTTSPYYPLASHVERFHRNLKVALNIYHNAQHDRWDENLHSLQMAFNTAWYETTGAPPASLFLEREFEDILSLKWDVEHVSPTPGRKYSTPSDAVSRLPHHGFSYGRR
jgi:hypothetical protein